MFFFFLNMSTHCVNLSVTGQWIETGDLSLINCPLLFSCYLLITQMTVLCRLITKVFFWMLSTASWKVHLKLGYFSICCMDTLIPYSEKNNYAMISFHVIKDNTSMFWIYLSLMKVKLFSHLVSCRPGG